MMYPKMKSKALRQVLALALFLCLAAGESHATGLTLEAAEQLALKNDYMFQAIKARSDSMSERSVTAEQLPDPQLKLGFANLPTDTFNHGQEAMTQTVVGVRQMFPRGHTRSLNGARMKESVLGSDAEAEDRKRKVVLGVREEFTHVFLHRQRQKILRQSLDVFTDLAEITRDYYATGRAHQQDVVQARLELSKVEERLSRIHQQEDEARARLAKWVGIGAYGELDGDWPQIAQPATTQQILDRLSEHPRIRAWQHEVNKSRISEKIARQAYKPGIAVDLAYGGRGGTNIDGSNRSDMLSVFVTMDIPLFTRNRQDRLVASSIAETSATEYARDDIYRSMQARVKENIATLAREQERLVLYRQTLLPQAAFNAQTAFEDYQDAVNDLTTLMRARIGEYELKLDYASLCAEEVITRAQLLYLQGEPS